MAKGDVMIKDAPLLEQISGREKIPVSYGGSEPMTVSIDQIKDFVEFDDVDLSEYAKKDDFKTINGESIIGEGDIKIQGGSGDSPIDYGEAEHSAVLKGETTALGETYKNEALNEGCVSLGANSKAGLKGYYFTYIDFETNQIWLHNKQFTSRALGSLGGWKKNSVSDSNRCGWSVDDVISFTCDGHYDNSATITDVTDNVITVDKLPFTLDDVPSTIVNIGVANNKFDECSVFCVKKYNIGSVELGGGAFAIGTNTKAVNAVAYAEGYNTTAYGKYSHAEGNETEAGYNAHSEGYLTKAIGARSHSEGRENIAEGNCSHAEGRDNKAIGENAHAEGWNTQALGKQSHSEGYNTIAKENQSHAEGKETQALGNASHAEGLQTIASGPSSHAEGEANVAGGDCSHVEGYLNETTKTGVHIEGKNNSSEDIYAHIEGVNNTANGAYSHIEGVGLSAIVTLKSAATESTLYEIQEDKPTWLVNNDRVWVQGFGELTIKEVYSSNWIKLSKKLGIGDKKTINAVIYSVSQGSRLVRTEGIGSHTEGIGTVAINAGECAVGRFNNSHGYDSSPVGPKYRETLFSVGCGTSNEARENAFEVKLTGDVFVKGIDEPIQTVIHRLEHGGSDIDLSDYLTKEEFNEVSERFASADSVQELSENVTELSTQVGGLSERIDNLPSGESDVFKAIYGTTTYEEVSEAYNQGKIIHCDYESRCYELAVFTGNIAGFSCLNTTTSYLLMLNADSSWSKASYGLENAGNRVDTIQADAKPYQYPSAKAVYDAIQQSGGGGKEWKCVMDRRMVEGEQNLDFTTFVDGTPLQATELMVQILQDVQAKHTFTGYVVVNSTTNKTETLYGSITIESSAASETNQCLQRVYLQASPHTYMVAEIDSGIRNAVAATTQRHTNGGNASSFQIYEDIVYMQLKLNAPCTAAAPYVKIYAR